MKRKITDKTKLKLSNKAQSFITAIRIAVVNAVQTNGLTVKFADLFPKVPTCRSTAKKTFPLYKIG